MSHLPPSYEESELKNSYNESKDLLDIQRRIEQFKPCRYCQSTNHQTRQHYSPLKKKLIFFFNKIFIHNLHYRKWFLY